MQLRFDVGYQERHHVYFSFDKFWGGVIISVDGQTVTNGVQMFSVSLVKRWQFVVGIHERHEVVIEKERKLLFAGFREQPVRAFVDGQLVAQGVA